MSRRSSLTIALAALALTAPAAQALPADPPLNTFTEAEQQAIASRGVGKPRPVTISAPAPAPVRVTAGDPGGFDWGSAAVGGAGVSALALLAAAGVAVTTRRGVRTARS